MSTVLGKSLSSFRLEAPASSGVFNIHWAALSHIGHVRKVNEDSLIADMPVFSVCDGMGGHASGDEASKLVVTQLAEFSGQDSIVPKEIYQALVKAEEQVDALTGEAELSGAGTTVTGLALTMEQDVPYWFVFNIGDSRVYRLVSGELEQVTIDHSLVQEMVDSGFLTPDEAEGHPDNNVITRAIGFHSDPLPDGWKIPVQDGERFLVCSDGLTKEVHFQEIAEILREAESVETAAQELQNLALGRSGRDNVSIIVLDTILETSAGHSSGGNRERHEQ